MGRAPRPRQRAAGQRPRRAIQLPAKYSHEFPVNEGHNYLLRAVPVDTWKRALKRSQAEDRAIRVVLIRALEEYAAGRLQV